MRLLLCLCLTLFSLPSWGVEKGLTLEQYEALYQRDRNDPDLLFYLGVALVRKGRWTEAEAMLKRCLELAPYYKDAAVQLVMLYIWEWRFDDAEAVCHKYPRDDPDFMELCALIAFKRGNYASSIEMYQKVLAKNPGRAIAEEGLALNFLVLHRYREARALYASISPKDAVTWRRTFEARGHVDPSVQAKLVHTASTEWDPSIGAPVVQTYYNALLPSFYIPISDRLQVDVRGILFQQKENQIYIPLGLNYNAVVTGGEGAFQYYFARGFTWNLVLRGISAWGLTNNERFPFQSTARVEPGTSFVYNWWAHLVALDAHLESFIIKNFANTTAQLLEMTVTDARYLFRPDVCYHPQAEVWLTESFYQDNLSNIRSAQGIEVKVSPMRETRIILLSAFFEHTNFKYLSQNYFSYKNQFHTLLGAKIEYLFDSGFSIDVAYLGGFQDIYDLLQPIGTFIYSTGAQNLNENRITAQIGYQWHDRLQANVSGYYFKNTLPYTAWDIRASILWQF